MVLLNSRSISQCINALWYFIKSVGKTISAFRINDAWNVLLKIVLFLVDFNENLKLTKYHYILQIQRETICRKYMIMLWTFYFEIEKAKQKQ